MIAPLQVLLPLPPLLPPLLSPLHLAAGSAARAATVLLPRVELRLNAHPTQLRPRLSTPTPLTRHPSLPIRYQVRHANGGWLQGFVLVTTFTTWQEWFKWNTFAPQAEVFAAADIPRLAAKATAKRAANKAMSKAKGAVAAAPSSSSASSSSGGSSSVSASVGSATATSAAAAAEGGGKGSKADVGAFGYGGMYKGHRVDIDGELARALERCSRSGNPHKEGVIWPRVAELSLLGGLGCGRWLMQVSAALV